MSQPPAPFGAAAAASALVRGQAEDVSRLPADQDDQVATPAAESAETPDGDAETEDGMGRAEEEKITALARRLSHISRQSSGYPEDGANTFINPTDDPTLDPNSEDFNSRKWVKNLLRITSRDPEKYPRRTAGVSFRNLSAFGYGTAADYQMDVGNMWLKGLGWLRSALGYGKKVRIDILRNFEGYVRSGEMLVVLGRPGR